MNQDRSNEHRSSEGSRNKLHQQPSTPRSRKWDKTWIERCNSCKWKRIVFRCLFLSMLVAPLLRIAAIQLRAPSQEVKHDYQSFAPFLHTQQEVIDFDGRKDSLQVFKILTGKNESTLHARYSLNGRATDSRKGAKSNRLKDMIQPDSQIQQRGITPNRTHIPFRHPNNNQIERIRAMKQQQSKVRSPGSLSNVFPPTSLLRNAKDPSIKPMQGGSSQSLKQQAVQDTFRRSILKTIKLSPPARKRPNEKVIYFVHIHKAAGSFMCVAATRNKLSVQTGQNCNVQSDQRCCGNEDTVEAQIKFANTTTYDFVAIEQVMYDSMAPEYYHYVVNLRQSAARYFSHWNHIEQATQSTKKTSAHADRSTGTGAHNTNSSAPVKDPSLSFRDWWSSQPDNWSTRILCGPKCMKMPKYQISRELFQYTLQRLDRFEDILFVEDMKVSYRKFAHKHNWTYAYNEKRNQKQYQRPLSYVQSLENGFSGAMTVTDWDPHMSVLDDALYEFAKRKAVGSAPFDEPSPLLQANLKSYFEQGPKRLCTNICCATTCSQY